MPIAWDRMASQYEKPPVDYTYQEFPRHLYGADGAIRVVTSANERDAALAEGWTLAPGGTPAPPPARGKKAK